MDFIKFRNNLRGDDNIVSEIAIDSRVNRIKAVEDIYGRDIDEVILSDHETYKLLCWIEANMDNTRGKYSNPVRKHYSLVNNKEFPLLTTYERKLLNH